VDGAPFRDASTQAAAASTSPAADQAAELVVLRLKNNSLLVGRVISEEGDNVVFDAGELGRMTIKKTDIVQRLEPAAIAAAFQSAAAGPPPAVAGGGSFAEHGKITWTRMMATTGFYMTPPYVLGQLDPRFPALTGKALKLPGEIIQVQSQLSVQRATERDLWFLEGSDSYTFADSIGKQVDNPVISVGDNFRFSSSERIYGVTRYTYSRDGVRQIKFANQTLLGVGFKVAAGHKLNMDLIPALALQYDKKGTPFDDRLLTGGGAMEILTWAVRPFAQVDQRVLAYGTFNESQYYGVDASVAFKGMITKVIGLTIGVSYTLDNAISLRPTPIPANALFAGQPPFNVFANQRSQAIVNSGLLVKF
jgi:hypothetical protein